MSQPGPGSTQLMSQVNTKGFADRFCGMVQSIFATSGVYLGNYNWAY